MADPQAAALTALFKVTFFKPFIDTVSKQAIKFDLRGAARKYRKSVKDRYNVIRVMGMSQPTPLRNLYVRVNILEKITAGKRLSQEDIESLLQRDQEDRLDPAKRKTKTGVEVANSLNKIIVLGKPGAGKTTFLKFLALAAIDNDLRTQHIPVFIGLKDWSDSGKSLLAFIVDQFDICGFPEAKPYVERMLALGKCLLLLDGFDEVTADVERAIREIRIFSDKYAANQFVLSCRIAAFNYVFVHFTEVEMADFDDEQIQAFVDSWFQAEPKMARDCWAELTARENAPVKELASNPLLLTLLCIAFDEQLGFPPNRAELYQVAVEALLRKWDSSRRIQRPEVYHALSLRKKESLLSRIAAETFEKGQYALKQIQVEVLIRAYIEHLPEANPEEVDVNSEAILKGIEAQHGLLAERARGIYTFSHLTLHEYFTAKYIVENQHKQAVARLVRAHLFDSKWREVFLLTAGMLEEADSLLVAMRSELSRAATTIQSILRQAADCVKPDTPFTPSASRAFALFYILGMAHALACDRDRALTRDRARALTRDRARDLAPALDRALDLARALFYDPALACARALAHALDFAHALNFAPALDRDFTRALDFAPALAPALARDRALDFALDRAHGRARDRDRDHYLYGSELLVRCMDVDGYVSKPVREQLMDSLLVEPWKPPKELKSLIS